MSSEVDWPARWQPEAVEAVRPYLGSDHLLEVWVGDPVASIDGTLITGYVYVGDDGFVHVIHDRSDRPDVYPWRMLAGPVLRVAARLPGKRRTILYSHPAWVPRH